jgi:hypothetical protein|tara:strand:+ start:6547 stop:6960 length:414 start_codon:yes stop_codon:yes gene_type:complete
MNYLADKPRKKELTEKQQTFLDNVVVTGGDLKKAAELAGYKGNHYQVIQSLKDELVDMAQNLLAHNAPRAAMKLVEVMDSDRPVPQASSKLQAAQTILDRVGVAKTERLNIDHNVNGGLFILPQKDTVIVEGEYEEG